MDWPGQQQRRAFDELRSGNSAKAFGTALLCSADLTGFRQD
jgi:hypothetical protein